MKQEIFERALTFVLFPLNKVTAKSKPHKYIHNPLGQKKKRKKIVVLPSSGISEKLGQSVRKLIFLKSTQKYKFCDFVCIFHPLSKNRAQSEQNWELS